MKILLVNTLYDPYRVGGAEISVQSLAENLVKEGLQVAVLTLGEKEEKVLINGVQVWRLKLQNKYWPFNSSKRTSFQKLIWHYRDRYNEAYTQKILTVLDAFSPDLVHTNNVLGFSVALWDLAHRRKIRVVHTLRDYYLQCVKTTRFKKSASCSKQCWECHFLSGIKKKSSQKVDAVVGISNSILLRHTNDDYFANAYKKIIYNGFKITKSRKKEFPKFNKGSHLRFGYIGQINAAKGVYLLIESFGKLANYNNWDLTIAGNVDEIVQREFTAMLPEGRIRFVGYVKKETFFEQINVLVVPSIWEEPFGRVIVEALIDNVLVLGSRKGGMKEILQSQESFTFNPSIKELYSLLERIVNNPKILNTFEFDENELERFSLDRMVEQYLQLYKELLNLCS